MGQHIEQDVLIGTAMTRRSIGANQSVSGQPPTSAANDNDCEGPWPLVPFPEGLTAIPGGQQEPIRRDPTGSVWPSFLREEVDSPQPVQESFRSLTTLYMGTVSIAEFGWLYLLWLALVRSVQWILS
jgi:hypothetical protein